MIKTGDYVKNKYTGKIFVVCHKFGSGKSYILKAFDDYPESLSIKVKTRTLLRRYEVTRVPELLFKDEIKTITWTSG